MNDLSNDETVIVEDNIGATRASSTLDLRRVLLHIFLFLLTYISVAYASVAFVLPSNAPIDVMSFWTLLLKGLPLATLIILFLTAHEFGHYFAARAHGVDATLPFYIPMPFFLFGTLGAVIRTRSPILTRKALFDIGISGPLAGFVVALIYLIIGMLTMPDIGSLLYIHPEYRMMPAIPNYGMHFGDFLLFGLLKQTLVSPHHFFPPMNEVYHYVFLAAGWFGMFVTALNLIPVGQLDGGHILYAMFGEKQAAISKWFVRLLFLIGIGSILSILLDLTRTYNPNGLYNFLQHIYGPPVEWISQHASWWLMGWGGWLLWVVILRFVVRVAHPPIVDETPIDSKRMALGWVAMGILVLTFSFNGLYEVPGAPEKPSTAPPVPSKIAPGDTIV